MGSERLFLATWEWVAVSVAPLATMASVNPRRKGKKIRSLVGVLKVHIFIWYMKKNEK
jgi:hypothetical protein